MDTQQFAYLLKTVERLVQENVSLKKHKKIEDAKINTLKMENQRLENLNAKQTANYISIYNDMQSEKEKIMIAWKKTEKLYGEALKKIEYINKKMMENEFKQMQI